MPHRVRRRDVARGLRIVTGGQSGVDRAALEVAVALGIPYGGWCPAGGWAEDLPGPPGVLALYPDLTPTVSTDPTARTLLNVREADAVLVIDVAGAASPGTDETRRCAIQEGRPLHHLPIDVERPLWLVGAARQVLVHALREAEGAPPTLDFAGPRESEAPGIQAAATSLLREILAPFAR
ncbi:Putative molybdenum carrier [Demequina mangrovi]|uniref:Putative molybdenum carrier n=2 Tax=Demequina mangrovi TaxID=1043493 RepID=A0A1H6V5C8_9MICO|nr:Putative molybdenum carrier [Demequina mangrovi]